MLARDVIQMASCKKQSAHSSLAFLASPLVPDQARYMNLGGLLKWARSLVCFVKDPQANDGSFVEPFRVNLVFKWILEFEDELAQWQRLLDSVETSLHFVPMVGDGVTQLQAGDADEDRDFDQLDLAKVQIVAKYLTGQAATWGDGDWNGAPGGAPGSPPPA